MRLQVDQFTRIKYGFSKFYLLKSNNTAKINLRHRVKKLPQSSLYPKADSALTTLFINSHINDFIRNRTQLFNVKTN